MFVMKKWNRFSTWLCHLKVGRLINRLYLQMKEKREKKIKKKLNYELST